MPRLAVLALAWLIGIAAAAFTDTDPAALVAAFGLLAAVSFAVSPRLSTLALVAAGAVLIAAAGWRYDSTQPEPSHISRLNGTEVTLRAVVSREPVERDNSRSYRLEVHERRDGDRWAPDSGAVQMTGRLLPAYDYGDRIEIEGKLEEPPVLEDFDYREYLLRHGISSVIAFPDTKLIAEGEGNTLRAAQIDVRTSLADGVSEALPEPEASLATGILLGAHSSLPGDLRDDMIKTGTSHLTAVSGQNVVLVAAFVIAMLTWAIGRRPAAWLALASLIAYALLVGGQPSVVRAGIMGAIYVGAIIAGRQNSAWYTLLLAAAIMTAIDPQSVHDVSFQLSFAATIGLVILASPLRDLFTTTASRWASTGEAHLAAPLAETVAVTLSAIVFTLPVMAINFDRISVVAPVANLFVVPAFVVVAFTSGIATAIGAIPGVDAHFMVWFAWPPAAYMTHVIAVFAAIPGATIGIGWVDTGVAIVYYALLFAGVWWLRRTPKVQIERPAPRPFDWPALQPALVSSLLLVLATTLLWLAITAPAEGRLSITFLDVGQGDAALIEGPEGHRILVDGGPSGPALKRALDRHLPFYDRRIDLVVLTHPQADHVGGLPAVIDGYDVGGVITTGIATDTEAYTAWETALGRAQPAQITARRGQWIDLGDGAKLTVIGPTSATKPDGDDPNDTSIVLRLTQGEFSFLLTGDITEDAEAALITAGTNLNADVLKVAHHGSRTSTSDAFLARTAPYVDVISVGASNPFGHPTDEVLHRLDGDLVLRTDLHGDITVSTDGERLWVSTQRGSVSAE
jgi:competence protein ComEC